MTPDFRRNLQRLCDLDVARSRTDVSAIEPLVKVSGSANAGQQKDTPGD